MVTGIEVSLEAAVAAWLVALALGAMIGHKRENRRPGGASDPLAGLFTSSALGTFINNANRRAARRVSSQAVLHGQIDQIAALRAGWDIQTRQEVIGHVAAVMKAGVRRSDNIITAEGDGFTIVLPGADESAAKGVADRLRRALAQIKLSQLGGGNRFTASFGVAAGSASESSRNLVARALGALEAAQMTGTNHVVAASEIEDVLFLPPPDRAAEAA